MPAVKKTEAEVQLGEELSKLSPAARQVIKVLATHGGEMEHKDIVARVTASEADLKLAFVQCRTSNLLYDTWPSAIDIRHVWKIAPSSLAVLQTNLSSLDS